MTYTTSSTGIFNFFIQLFSRTINRLALYLLRKAIKRVTTVPLHPSDIYRTNMFHVSSLGCALVLQKDLEYWGIDELMMEPCCALKYYPEIEQCVNEKQVSNKPDVM